MRSSRPCWPVLVVVVALLLGTVAPILTLPVSATDGGPSAGDHRAVSQRPGTAPPTPLERKRAAVSILSSIHPVWPGRDGRLGPRTGDRLNGTLRAYRDGYRPSNGTVFVADGWAVARLSRRHWTNESAADRAIDLIVDADRATVNTSIEDARRALRRTGSRVESPRRRRRATAALRRAVAARNRSLDLLRSSGGAPKRGLSGRSSTVAAVRALALAWVDTQRTLDVLDEATAPRLIISSRGDLPTNHTGPITRTIRGNVSDVRAYELGAVTVAVNGTTVARTPLDASTAPARNASFAVNVSTGGPVATVTASISDVEEHERRGGTSGWSRDGDRAGARESAVWRALNDRLRRRDSGRRDGVDQTATDVVRFDGDGLPDRYETTVVGFDPLDPDSDVPTTAVDEGADGVLDGGEDVDGDRLVAYAEFELGTDPFASDTDADGLPDRFEASAASATNPTVADTAGDGVVDGNEDFDGDGLVAAAELANGTSVASIDTDHDGLSDGREVRDVGTSPVDADTDDDGLTDGAELRLATDPLASDTDGDGTPDGNETYQTVTTDVETGVRVAVDGPGDAARGVSVENVSQPAGPTVPVSPVVRIRCRGAFDRARVTIPFGGGGTPATIANRSIYTWEPGSGRPWHRLNTTVDVVNRTATTTVSSFSYFAVMDDAAWKAAISAPVSLAWPRGASFDDLAGWDADGSVRVENGTVRIGGPHETTGDRTIVVSPNGSGDFRRIQPAVRAAHAGDTILVRDGTYDGSVVLDTSVRLVGDNATLDGSTTRGDHTVGISIEGSRHVSVEGLTITSYSTGIRADPDTDSIVVARTRIENATYGIDASETSGDWTLSNVTIVGAEVDGVRAEHSSGDWTIRHVVVQDSDVVGLAVIHASGNWTLDRVDVSSNGFVGIVVRSGSPNVSVSNAVITSNGINGVQDSTTGRLVLTKTRLVENGKAGIYGVDSTTPIDATGDWWGQPTGPEPGQVAGKVVTTPSCSTPDCAPTAIDVFPPGTPRGDGSTSESSPIAPRGASSIRRTTTLPGNVSDIELTARVKGTGPATVEISDGNESRTVASSSRSIDVFEQVSTDLADFAGETVTITAAAEAGGAIELDWIDVAVDTDGDGLRDAVENADLGMPMGPNPGSSLASLDPTNPDTDGDGIPDGEELTGVALVPRSSGLRGGGALWAKSAVSDPTKQNSDGGGLNDAEELTAGSDPFVLETLVVGYTLPTMTHGPNDTLEDRQPMTVGQAHGLQSSGGPDSDLIVQPSRQYFDPIFCIKQLTGGPGCAPSWMIGVEPKKDKHYVYFPFVVYAGSNVDIGLVPYQMSFASDYSSTMVKSVNVSGRVGPGESRRGYVVYELPDFRTSEESQPRAFRSIGRVKLRLDLSKTIFRRSQPAKVERGYTSSTSTLLPATEQMLEDTQYVLQKGINVALSAESGETVTIKTGSVASGAIVFLYDLAKSQVNTPPTSVEDVAKSVSVKGIGSFQKKIERSEGQIYKEIYGDGVVRASGSTIIRQD